MTMEEKNQNTQQQENQPQNKYREVIIFYFDMMIRGLISFIFVGFILTLILLQFHTPLLWILIIAFCISILISPLFMKIKLGEKFLTWYESRLDSAFKKK